MWDRCGLLGLSPGGRRRKTEDGRGRGRCASFSLPLWERWPERSEGQRGGSNALAVGFLVTGRFPSLLRRWVPCCLSHEGRGRRICGSCATRFSAVPDRLLPGGAEMEKVAPAAVVRWGRFEGSVDSLVDEHGHVVACRRQPVVVDCLCDLHKVIGAEVGEGDVDRDGFVG